MTGTVFWSWQADLEGRCHRGFIRDALVAALDRVNAELDLEDVERGATGDGAWTLDHDTKSAAGMADIAATVLERIAAADVFVADVTPIARSAGGKALPNPNVMVELGYAMSAITPDRIVAVLNRASGFRHEDLPFDIRHRRILTYDLAAGATRAELRQERERLVVALAGALSTNLTSAREARAAARPIEGVAESREMPGLWDGHWPATLQAAFGEERHISPIEAARAFVRVIPAGWNGERPSVAQVFDLPRGCGVEAPMGAGTSGARGIFDLGVVTYWGVGGAPAIGGPTPVANLAAFLDESGEIWSVDGRILNDRQEQVFIAHQDVLRNWIRGLDMAHRVFDSLDASQRRRVVVGARGLDGSWWHIQTGYVPGRGRKDVVEVDRTRASWGPDERIALLRDVWNDLRDAYGQDHVDAEEFARYHAARA